MLFRSPSAGHEYHLNIALGRWTIGTDMLDAVADKPAEIQERFGQLLFLHELYHDDQGLMWSNFSGVGRAGVVLEKIDFTADAFSLELLIMREIKDGGDDAKRKVGKIASQWIGIALTGIESFDRLAGQKRIDQLSERRLRRYLTWYLQQARAETLRDPRSVAALFDECPIVELAPVEAKLDERSDKIVIAGLESTELVLEFKGQLKRRHTRADFQPRELVDAICNFERERVLHAMRAVVTEERGLLAPWTEIGQEPQPDGEQSIDDALPKLGRAIAGVTHDGGIVNVSTDWRSLRDWGHTRDRLNLATAGDKWYFVCISPEGFTMHWGSEIEEALLRGVQVNFAVLDLSTMMKNGTVGKRYAESVCVLGVDNAIQSIKSNLENLELLRRKVCAQRQEPLLRVYLSLVPHTCLAFLSEPANRDSRNGWGLVYPYLMYPSVNRAHNLGLLFVDKGDEGLYAKYLDSFQEYFRLLRSSLGAAYEQPR